MLFILFIIGVILGFGEVCVCCFVEVGWLLVFIGCCEECL